jgi:hypothetical protein
VKEMQNDKTENCRYETDSGLQGKQYMKHRREESEIKRQKNVNKGQKLHKGRNTTKLRERNS